MTSIAGNQNYGRRGVELRSKRYGFTNQMKASKYQTLFSMNPILKKRIWKAVRLGFKEMHLVGERIEVTRDKSPTGTYIFTARKPRRNWSIYVQMEWNPKEDRAMLRGIEGAALVGQKRPTVELEFEDYEDVPEIVRDWLEDPKF